MLHMKQEQQYIHYIQFPLFTQEYPWCVYVCMSEPNASNKTTTSSVSDVTVSFESTASKINLLPLHGRTQNGDTIPWGIWLAFNPWLEKADLLA